MKHAKILILLTFCLNLGTEAVSQNFAQQAQSWWRDICTNEDARNSQGNFKHSPDKRSHIVWTKLRTHKASLFVAGFPLMVASVRMALGVLDGKKKITDFWPFYRPIATTALCCASLFHYHKIGTLEKKFKNLRYSSQNMSEKEIAPVIQESARNVCLATANECYRDRRVYAEYGRNRKQGLTKFTSEIIQAFRQLAKEAQKDPALRLELDCIISKIEEYAQPRDSWNGNSAQEIAQIAQLKTAGFVLNIAGNSEHQAVWEKLKSGIEFWYVGE